MPVKSKSLLTAGSITLATGVGAGSAFVVNILAARTLGPELRGNVALVLQLSYFIAPILLFGADRKIIKLGPNARSTHLPAATVIGALGALATPVCYLIAGPQGLWAIPVAVVGALFAIGRAWNISFQKPMSYLLWFSTYQVTIVAQSAILYLMGVTIWELWLIVYILPGLALAYLHVRHIVSLGGGGFRAQRRVAVDGLQFVGGTVAHMVTTRFERIALPVMTGSMELGLYVVVATATEPIMWFAQAISDARVSSGSARTTRAKAVLADLLIFAGMAVAGGLAIFNLIVPLFGDEFAESKNLVLPLMIAAVLLALYRQFAGRILAARPPRVIALTEMVIAASAVPLYIWQISIFGSAAGAAWGSVVVYTVALIISSGVTAYIQRSDGPESGREVGELVV